MDDIAFLASTASDDATAVLQVLLPDGTVERIPGVSPLRILDRCPLLYHALEFGEYGVRQASIEATSRYAIVSLLRYMYTGDYLPNDQPGYLLSHAETYKIAENYDVPELQVSAYVNFSTQIECSCSIKEPPAFLCEAVRFIYEHLVSNESRREHSLLDTLLHYCLTVFSYQGLGERTDFRQLVLDLPAFHRHLCRMSMQRDFLDDGASDLMRMPVSTPTPYSHDALHKRALGDFQFELWQDSEDPSAAWEETVEGSPSKRRRSNADGRYTLVHRPKDAATMPTFSESGSGSDSSSDEDGFTLVHRPRGIIGQSTAADPPSSPSRHPASPGPLLVEAEETGETLQLQAVSDLGSESDDEWSVVQPEHAMLGTQDASQT